MAGRQEIGKVGTTHVSFVCQRCRQPLKLDHSFNTLDQQLLTELTGMDFIVYVTNLSWQKL